MAHQYELYIEGTKEYRGKVDAPTELWRIGDEISIGQGQSGVIVSMDPGNPVWKVYVLPTSEPGGGL